MIANGSNQVGLALRVQSLNSQKHHRKASLSGYREVRMEVMVQRDTNASVFPGFGKNKAVIRLAQSDFSDVAGIETILAKYRRCSWGEPLVQQ